MKAAAALLALALAGCTKTQFDVEFPRLPDLSAETAKPCPPIDPVTGNLGDLAVKDTALAIEYARCQGRAAAAVGAYQTAQRLLQAAEDQADKAKSPTKAH